MNDHKYVGLDVHQATIPIAVHNHLGKRITQSIQVELMLINNVLSRIRQGNELKNT